MDFASMPALSPQALLATTYMTLPRKTLKMDCLVEDSSQ